MTKPAGRQAGEITVQPEGRGPVSAPSTPLTENPPLCRAGKLNLMDAGPKTVFELDNWPPKAWTVSSTTTISPLGANTSMKISAEPKLATIQGGIAAFAAATGATKCEHAAAEIGWAFYCDAVHRTHESYRGISARRIATAGLYLDVAEAARYAVTSSHGQGGSTSSAGGTGAAKDFDQLIKNRDRACREDAAQGPAALNAARPASTIKLVPKPPPVRAIVTLPPLANIDATALPPAVSTTVWLSVMATSVPAATARLALPPVLPG